MIRRKAFVTPLALSALMLLSGCSGHTGIEALERPQVSGDAVPAGVNLTAPISRESVRLLTIHEEVHYFAATSEDKADGCIIIVPPGAEPDWFAGCGLLGASGEIVTASKTPNNNAATLLRDDADTRIQESEGWTRIHKNVLIPNT